MTVHKLIITVKTDNRFDRPTGQLQLRDMIADRIWRMDGVHHEGVDAALVGGNVAIVPVYELERLQAFERDHTAK